jgi:ribulose-5-phosphate 4-epimerase/fuculose-1-phosphate aldolase
LPDEDLFDLVTANHILFRQRVVDGFGHVSLRDPARADRFWMARRMAPRLVSAADILPFDLDGNVIAPDQRPIYLERFIHGEIYRVRPDVMSVVHSHSPAVIPFGIVRGLALRPVWHMSGFLGAGAPVFEIRDHAGAATDLLIRNRRLGASLAHTLGDSAVVLMRGHGATVVGGSLRRAVFRAVYAELNASLLAEALRLGPVTYLTPDEAQTSAATIDGQIDRAWTLWATDPE